jgi:hypothetical protein
MNRKETRKVYIIESPSPKDLLDGRNEGIALSEMLSLAQIHNQRHTVVDVDTWLEAFGRIVTDIKRSDNSLGIVDLHFSMHGSPQGICLTDGQVLPWTTLYQYIKWFNDRVGYMDIDVAPGKLYGPASLNFSCCDGFHAKELKASCTNILPYTLLIGPAKVVGWSDSLIAFASYYHNAIHKNFPPKHAVKMMNIAAGLEDIFHIDIADGLEPIKSFARPV